MQLQSACCRTAIHHLLIHCIAARLSTPHLPTFNTFIIALFLSSSRSRILSIDVSRSANEQSVLPHSSEVLRYRLLWRMLQRNAIWMLVLRRAHNKNTKQLSDHCATSDIDLLLLLCEVVQKTDLDCERTWDRPSTRIRHDVRLYEIRSEMLF